MKFVLISNNLNSVKNFRTDLLLAIAKRGYEIHILAPSMELFVNEKNLFQSYGFVLHEISLSRAGTNPIADFKTCCNIYQILRRIKPNAVLAYTIKPVIYGMLAAHLAAVPQRFALISGLGFAFQTHEQSQKLSVIKKIINCLYTAALSRSSKVFFQNHDDQQLLRQLGILKPAIPAVVVNGSGVNISHFHPVPAHQVNTQYSPSFLMVARLLHDKGIREYFQAATQLKQHFPQAQFHLVGGLDENPAAISQTELDAMVASGVINYWGRLDDVREAIAQANVFVLPSYREGVPRSVLEAMSMARAIVTTDAPGCKETVLEGVNGFKVAVQSVEALSQAMQCLIEDPERMIAMGQASRQLAVEKYDVHQVNAHMISEMKL